MKGQRAMAGILPILIAVFLFFNPHGAFAEDYSALIEKGIALYEKGDFDKAIRELKQVITEMKEISESESRNDALFNANLYLGMTYLGKGKESLAKESFRNAFKALPHKTLSTEQYPPKVVSLYNEVVSQSLSSLSVKSNMPDAEVFVDDIRKGVAPIVIRNLLPGVHTVKIVAMGQEIEKTVNLEPGRDTGIGGDFQNTGSVSVTSDPAASAVYLNGRLMGVTPLVMKDIPAGEHTLIVSKTDYVESSQKIIVKGNEVADVDVRLSTVAYSVRLFSVPEDAEVFWDETSKGMTPVVIENVTAGMHRVRIVKDGYEEQKDTIEVKTSLTEKTYRLNPYTGSLHVKTDPFGVEVTIDDRNVGATPLSVSALPAKQYLVKLKKEGYKGKDITVIVAKDKTSEINEMLLELDTQKPEIIFEPPAKAIKENKNYIRARIMDNQAVGDVSLMLRMEGEINFQPVKMSSPIKGVYEAVIPELYLKKGAVLDYYITACDIQNNCEISGSKSKPYNLKVISLEPYTEGFVLDVDSERDRVTISLGTVDNVKKDDRYIVFRTGQELRNPKTGELLQIEEIFVGTIRVKELMPRTAYAGIDDIEMPIAKNDRIRRQVSAPTGGMTEGNYATKIVLKWAPNREPEVKGYRIYRSSKANGEYQKVGEIDERDNTVYEDKDDMSEGLIFYYRIAAFNIFDTDGVMSEPVAGKTKKGVLPPDNIKAYGKVREAQLKWSIAGQDHDIERYIIYRSETEGGKFAEIAQVDRDIDSYADKDSLQDGKTYYYKIAGRSIHGSVGEQSKPVSTETKQRPKAPGDFSAEGGLARKVNLKWSKNEEKDISEYWLYRGLDGKVESSPHMKLKANVNSFTDTDLKDSTRYLYALKAVDADGLASDLSGVAAVVTKALPKPPAGFKGHESQGKILLTWEPNKEPDIKAYNVYRKGWMKSTLLTSTKETSCEIKIEDRPKTIKLHITAVDKDGLESVPSEEIDIKLQ